MNCFLLKVCRLDARVPPLARCEFSIRMGAIETEQGTGVPCSSEDLLLRTGGLRFYTAKNPPIKEFVERVLIGE